MTSLVVLVFVMSRFGLGDQGTWWCCVFAPICACALARSGGYGNGLLPQKPLALPGGATI